MTDPALVLKKAAEIETYIGELRRLARPAEIDRAEILRRRLRF